jgi:sulfur carrier protein
MINITLNGKPKELSGITDLESTVEQFCKDKTPVIAELNGEIIKPPQWKEMTLKEGDTLELISFVGGG